MKPLVNGNMTHGMDDEKLVECNIIRYRPPTSYHNTSYMKDIVIITHDLRDEVYEEDKEEDQVSRTGIPDKFCLLKGQAMPSARVKSRVIFKTEAIASLFLLL